MSLETLSQMNQPVPLILHVDKVTLDCGRAWVLLIDQSRALVIDGHVLLFAELKFVQKLLNE